MAHAQYSGSSPPPSPPLLRRVLASPHSVEGKRSGKCLVGFVVAMLVFFLVEIPVLDGILEPLDGKAVTYPWMALMFATLGVAALISFAGGYFAVVAIVKHGERSILLVVPVLLALYVALFAVSEIGGHEEPGREDSGVMNLGR